MRRSIHVFALVALAVSGCASVPKETVTLSETIAQQTASLQNAHEALVSRYYGEMRNRVDEFMTDVWIPTFLAKAVANQAVQTQVTNALGAANLNTDAVVQKITADNTFTAAEKAALTNAVSKAKIDGRAQFGELMIKFSEEATRQIGLQRKALVAPIDEQEQLVLTQLRETYASLQAEQATVKAFLASAVTVQSQQDQLLQRLNLLDQRNAALNTALALSDRATTTLATVENLTGTPAAGGATSGETQAAKFLEELKKVNDALRAGSKGKDGKPDGQ